MNYETKTMTDLADIAAAAIREMRARQKKELADNLRRKKLGFDVTFRIPEPSDRALIDLLQAINDWDDDLRGTLQTMIEERECSLLKTKNAKFPKVSDQEFDYYTGQAGGGYYA